MRRIAAMLVTACLLASFVQVPAGGSVLGSRCRLVGTVDGPTLKMRYRLWNDGVRDDWRVKFFRDDALVYQRIHTTDADGRFLVVRRYENFPGRETLVGSAKHLDSGVVCRVTIRI